MVQEMMVRAAQHEGGLSTKVLHGTVLRHRAFLNLQARAPIAEVPKAMPTKLLLPVAPLDRTSQNKNGRYAAQPAPFRMIADPMLLALTLLVQAMMSRDLRALLLWVSVLGLLACRRLGRRARLLVTKPNVALA